MPRRTAGLRRATAIVLGLLLSVPMAATVRADQQAKQTHAIKPHRQHPAFGQPQSHASASSADQFGCTWPYKNQFPPCMSTWPAGAPDYHGSNGY